MEGITSLRNLKKKFKLLLMFLRWNVSKITTWGTRLQNWSVTKNAMEVDGGTSVVRQCLQTSAYNDGNGCGGAVQAQHFSSSRTLTTCSFWSASGGGICNLMKKGGALHKNIFCRRLRTSLFPRLPVGMAIEVCDGEKSYHRRQFFFYF